MKKTSLIALTIFGCFFGCSDTNYVPGKDGSGCHVTTVTGGAKLTCDDGTSAFIANGSMGPTGPQGLPGPQGLMAQGDTVVKFCESYQTNYPSTFPEYGICVNGDIYAVYWDTHNAWLALIVPGYYASTSTSAPCNFTILNNCSISN